MSEKNYNNFFKIKITLYLQWEELTHAVKIEIKAVKAKE